jgi:hypothetical protein
MLQMIVRQILHKYVLMQVASIALADLIFVLMIAVLLLMSVMERVIA